MHSSILVHYGELALKGGNRSYFEKLLLSNIEIALRGSGSFTLRRLQGRICIDFKNMTSQEDALGRLQNVFGVANIAFSKRIPTSMGEIEKTVASLVDEDSFKSFAIRTKRNDKRFEFSSSDINIRIGKMVQEKTKASVDLENPERTISIEIVDDNTFVFTKRYQGSGGLPVGSAGKVACLISGGIDSPVAAWRMMRRGCAPFYIHFHSAPFTSQASVEKVIDLVEHLSRGLQGVKLALVPFGNIQQKIVRETSEAYRVLLYRRFMMRIAEVLAKGEGAEALVTGEALSQVASQTLSNLASIESVLTLPLLRPLVGMDKQEIVDQAKKIGTFQTACEPHDDCCSFLMPQFPKTHSNLQEMESVESSLDIEALVQLGIKETVTSPIFS
ncbi:MAG: tRNA 4-thiouridine(8) synthase ThiI [Deltaproteobacteria bacterium RIFCSPLOWO2_02_FULL_44_10]|nr:MAG: tRNA 4-thiouridine(8) synthase ThiI [Deltaproteobacteria bacterium RIFCSPHIGHO2_02_FULL_44_16]OGQ47373.1 MAG: tRNA 4-thiouridine(8) synthase ThiI [Deltaproteobacteria bacterium RIFCSPLOWO2_02_FULL_44_10]